MLSPAEPRLAAFLTKIAITNALPMSLSLAVLAALRIGAYQLFWLRTPKHAAVGDTVEAVKAGKPIPSGTVLTLVQWSVHQDDKGNPLKDSNGRFIKKDVLAHTIAVVRNTRPELLVRLAALFHDMICLARPLKATEAAERGIVTRDGRLAFEMGFLHYVRPGGRDLPQAAERCRSWGPMRRRNSRWKR